MCDYLFIKKRHVKRWCIVGIIIISIYFVIVQKISSSHPDTSEGVYNGIGSGSNHAIIIWWTPFIAEDKRVISCYDKKYSCLLTKDRKHHHSTDNGKDNAKAFLFYGSNFDPSDLPLPKEPNKKHIWALLHEESPRNVGLFLSQETFSIFDTISTFSRHSDMPLTLQYLENLSFLTNTRYVIDIKEKNTRIILQDLAPVLYIQSDCDTPNNRDLYVEQLMKHIKIDSYGKCLNNKQQPPELSQVKQLDLFNENLVKLVARYKFVIAFENAICEDYITEKLWRPLSAGSVPIYYGSPSVEDWLPNPDSAILVDKFSSPKSLADYIKLVNKNDTLYNSFLRHKQGIVENIHLKNQLAKGPNGIENGSQEDNHPISAFECFVCKQLHRKNARPVTNKSQVYNCRYPNSTSWRYYWDNGKCQGAILKKSVETNQEYKQFVGDHCEN